MSTLAVVLSITIAVAFVILAGLLLYFWYKKRQAGVLGAPADVPSQPKAVMTWEEKVTLMDGWVQKLLQREDVDGLLDREAPEIRNLSNKKRREYFKKLSSNLSDQLEDEVMGSEFDNKDALWNLGSSILSERLDHLKNGRFPPKK